MSGGELLTVLSDETCRHRNVNGPAFSRNNLKVGFSIIAQGSWLSRTPSMVPTATATTRSRQWAPEAEVELVVSLFTMNSQHHHA